MTLFPSYFGKPMIKAIETSVHRWIGMASDFRNPRVLIISTFLLENQTFCHKVLNINFKIVPKKIFLDPVVGFLEA